jgi:hypothetical protein
MSAQGDAGWAYFSGCISANLQYVIMGLKGLAVLSSMSALEENQ